MARARFTAVLHRQSVARVPGSCHDSGGGIRQAKRNGAPAGAGEVPWQQWTETPLMSDYDYRNPEDPFQRDAAYDPSARSGNAAWGWVAAAVFVAIVLAVVFGMGHQPGQNGTNTAANETRPPAST